MKFLQSSHSSRLACKVFGWQGEKFTVWSLLGRVMPFLLLWTAANYSYSQALLHISPSVGISISSCNAAIVYLLSILILGESFVAFKVCPFETRDVSVVSSGVGNWR